ncbi:MAG: antibiotic biosynthesis monooxygenase (ABM) superfamily enzyme [Cellvibrionaceae bacterium]|jgi:antibiotic biosynthesis monooxygenase (ABM) superfamily enzyme
MENKNTPVSVVVDRNVLPGKVKEFKKYIGKAIEASSKFPGYLGTDIINPEGNDRYIIVFRFSSKEKSDDWIVSEERHFWVSKIDQVIEKPTELVSLTGMETWFTLSKAKNFVPPPKFKMAIVTYLAIAPTLTTFDWLFGAYFSSMPNYLVFFVSSPFVVILMTYAVMPMMTKLFKNFLYPMKKIS